MTSQSHDLTDAVREQFRRTDAIFDAALDLPPNERAEYLTNACGGDDTLRGRVQTLLDAFDRSSGFLQSPAVELARVLLDDPAPVHRAPQDAGPFRSSQH